MKPMKYGVGQPLRRTEDERFITGQGRYIADSIPAGTLVMAVLRSPHAKAKVLSIDTSAAEALEGVKLVLTGKDIADFGDVPCMGPVGDMPVRPIPLLAKGEVRHVGDAVAAVVATSREAALDALEQIVVDYQDEPAVVDTGKALDPSSPLVWPELGSNLAYDTSVGDKAAAEAAFAKAAKVVKLELINQRVVANYMETRGCIGSVAPDGRLHLRLGSQGVHGIRGILAEHIFKRPESDFHVVTDDVGGGFGTKIFAYREYALVLIAAERLKEPVAWVGERAEHFQGDAHGRDNVSIAELALDADNRFLGLKADTLSALGAYTSQYGPDIAAFGSLMLPGLYHFEGVYGRIRGVYTNTAPVDAYRGAGRPEAAYLIERLVDTAAADLGVDPVELRLKNFAPASAMPYKTGTGRTYDSGEFDGHLKQAMQVADRAGFPARDKAAAAKGRIRGFGFASYVEICAFDGGESAVARLDQDGGVTVLIGTQSNGQGHATAYGQLAAQHLDIPIEKVRLVQGDTDRIATGGGTGGSRSIPTGGVAVSRAAESLVEKLKTLAADALEASPADLVAENGRIVVAGTDRAIDYAAIAALPAATPEAVKADGEFTQPEGTYPNGTHVCEVEIDPETGFVEVVGYHVVDDFGNTVNPLLLAGQIHGGVAQGLGQALMEGAVYDDASGQLLTATFMDYAVPRAADLMPIAFETRNVPSITNALGIKGAGEAGTIGSTPAVVNAVVDALRRHYGIRTLDMPLTPQKIWRAIRSAKVKTAA